MQPGSDSRVIGYPTPDVGMLCWMLDENGRGRIGIAKVEGDGFPAPMAQSVAESLRFFALLRCCAFSFGGVAGDCCIVSLSALLVRGGADFSHQTFQG